MVSYNDALSKLSAVNFFIRKTASIRERKLTNLSEDKIRYIQERLASPCFKSIGSLYNFSKEKTNETSKSNKIMKKNDIQLKTFSEDSSSKKKFNKVLKNSRSDIDNGLDTFSLLNKIHKKDPSFNISLPEMVILNCGFAFSIYISSENKLKFLIKEEISEIKECIVNIFNKNNSNKNSGCPIIILKFRGRNRKLIYSSKEFLESFPDLSTDCIIQKYIPPKGLKAIKYRAVVSDFDKIYIYSNKTRIDTKKDVFKKKNSINLRESYQNIEKTLANHKEIASRIRTSHNWKQFSGIKGSSSEKLSIFSIFREKNFDEENKTQKILEDFKPSTRFLTHEDIEKTDLYEGKNKSFENIIYLTKYLKNKIDNYALDDFKLTELAVDYLQDNSGKWYLLKIKYGKTVKKNDSKNDLLKKVQKKGAKIKNMNNLLSCSKK